MCLRTLQFGNNSFFSANNIYQNVGFEKGIEVITFKNKMIRKNNVFYVKFGNSLIRTMKRSQAIESETFTV